MTSFPLEYNLVLIELEIDLAGQGGIQRFKTVGDFSVWLNEELEFWNWLRQEPVITQFNGLGQFRDNFFQCTGNCSAYISQLYTNWQTRQKEYERLSSNADEKSREDQLKTILFNFQNDIQEFKNRVSSILVQEIVRTPHHFFRGSIEAEFIKSLAEEDARVAVHALHQLLSEKLKTNQSEIFSSQGRTLAVLFKRGLLPKKQGQKLAYAETVKTWSRELGHFKNDYELLLQNFETSRNAIADALKKWQETAFSLQDDFKAQKETNQKDLENLKETYEAYMQLHGARSYWARKRQEHTKMIKVFRLWAIITAALGLPLTGC